MAATFACGRLAGTLVFGLLALLRPSLLAPLNRVATVRLFGGKLLSLGFDREAKSYWHRRTPPGRALQKSGQARLRMITEGSRPA
jgi:hypothetical protein